MTMTKDHIGGLVFLCLSLTYGYFTGNIPLLPGEEFEGFHAQTMPYALSSLGAVLSLALLITGSRDQHDRLSLAGYDFRLVGKLLLLIILFGIALKWLGFLVSTVLFLIAGYWLLGERRPKILLIASLPFAIGLWLILTQLLDVYLAPGRLFTTLFGG